jgi:Zn-dependent protease with chaperone function
MIGIMPVYIMLLVVVGCAITIFGMVRSLLIRGKSEDPGRALTQDEARGMYDLTGEVARALDTRPIDEIRITPGIDLAVYERGSWLSKIRNNGKRILILGAGIVKDFRKDEFSAVLAHEYGHFAHRDTAGGAVAFRVKRDIFSFYQSLYRGGQAVWWNIAFQFLRLYHLIFRRISHGAGRLQEVLADQVSAKTYGAAPFKGGLTFVTRRGIAFPTIADQEIHSAVQEKRQLLNLYSLPLISNETIEEAVTKQMEEKTSADDTHPCIKDRFRYVDRISALGAPRDGTPIQNLFLSWDELAAEMTRLVEQSIRQSS